MQSHFRKETVNDDRQNLCRAHRPDISLYQFPAETEQLVTAHLATGHCSSVNHVFLHALRTLKDYSEPVADIEDGIADEAAGRMRLLSDEDTDIRHFPAIQEFKPGANAVIQLPVLQSTPPVLTSPGRIHVLPLRAIVECCRQLC